MKFGWIGIALACVVGLGALTHDHKYWTTSTPVSVEEEKEGLSASSQLIGYDRLVCSIQRLLWPEMLDDLKDGTWDSVYRPLSQKQIDSLVSFHRIRGVSFSYEEDSWDCDDFALEFLYRSRVWGMGNLLHPSAPPVVGMVLAKVNRYELFEYQDRHPFYHAFNVILRDDGQWLFYEPQTHRMMPIQS